MVRLADPLGMTIAVDRDANLFKASILFVGHGQTVQNQIRRHKYGVTVCLLKFLLKGVLHLCPRMDFL